MISFWQSTKKISHYLRGQYLFNLVLPFIFDISENYSEKIKNNKIQQVENILL